jgi:hypothetical protein
MGNQTRVEDRQHRLDGALLAAMVLAWVFAAGGCFYIASGPITSATLSSEPITTGQKVQTPRTCLGPSSETKCPPRRANPAGVVAWRQPLTRHKKRAQTTPVPAGVSQIID